MAKINLGNNRYAVSTPAQEQAAKDKIAELLGNEEFVKRYNHDNPRIRSAAINEMALLQGQAYGNEPIIADAFSGTASRTQE